MGDQDGEARLLNGIGWVYVLGGQYDQGVVYAGQALELYRAINNQQGQAVALDTLSRACGGLNEHDQAITYCLQAIDLYQTTGNKYFQAQTLARLGDVYHAVSDLTAARDTWQQALAIFDELGHSDADTVRAKLTTLDADRDEQIIDDQQP
jgi:tetratricopeptide (TPR) repeat protein